MTKAELLVDLEARDGIERLWGDPRLVATEPAPGGIGGTVNVYAQGVIESDKGAAIKKDEQFYVFDEGEAEEVAFYKGGEPTAQVKTSEFIVWMREAITASIGDYEGIMVHHIDERWEMVFFSIVVEPATPDGTAEWKHYYLRKGNPKVEITNHDMDFLRTVLR